MVRLHAELFCHIGHDIGLADCLSAVDWQCLIGVGALHKIRIHKALARHLIHGAQDRALYRNTPAAQGQQEFHAIVILLIAGRSRHGQASLPALLACYLDPELNWNSAAHSELKGGRPQ